MIDIARQRLTYVLSDYIAINIGWLIFNIVRYYSIPDTYISGDLYDLLTDTTIITGQILFPCMMTCLYWISGYYNRVFLKSRLDELLNTITVSFIGTIIIYFVALINDNIQERMQNYELMAVLWTLLFALSYIVRLTITIRATRRIHNGEISFNTLIVGTTQGALNLAKKIESMPRSTGFNIVGYVEPSERTVDTSNLDRPLYRTDQLDEVCRQLDIKNFIVIPHRSGMKETVATINSLFPFDKSIFITPDLYQLITTRARLSTIVGEPLIDISRTNAPESTLNIKRLSDIIVSALTLVIISPVLAAIALMIKKDSPGPIIYRQQRIGLHKKPFFIYKFRSMYVDAETYGPSLASVDDPRITKIGRFLRKYRLDELPQFWNVLTGDMSLVGPRPEREYYIRQIISRAPYYSLIHQVRPGITSWGMVKYGYASDVDQMIERLRYDLLYIENISFGVDLKILFYTINTVLTGKGV